MPAPTASFRPGLSKDPVQLTEADIPGALALSSIAGWNQTRRLATASGTFRCVFRDQVRWTGGCDRNARLLREKAGLARHGSDASGLPADGSGANPGHVRDGTGDEVRHPDGEPRRYC